MSELQVKEAVAIAKRYVSEVFADDGLGGASLEEVDSDDARSVWRITVGFSRLPGSVGLAPLLNATTRRHYKVVSIDQSRKVLSVKNRESSYAG